MKYILSSILCLTLFASCATKTTDLSTTSGTFYGEEFKPSKVHSYDQMLSKVKNKGGFEGQVKANADAVCQVKGCWMSVSEKPELEEMFVKFKDYGFFMPLDLSGPVVMNGQAYYDTTSVDELRHYAEDAGKSAEEISKITKPEVELKFMASGVLVPE